MSSRIFKSLSVFSSRGYLFEVIEVTSSTGVKTYKVVRKSLDGKGPLTVHRRLTLDELIAFLSHSAEDGSFMRHELAKNRAPALKSLTVGLDL